MALTITRTAQTIVGDRAMSWFKIAWPNPYVSGGISLTPREIGLSVIELILFEPALGYTFEYDYTNALVICYTTAATEAGAIDLSGMTDARGFAIGQP